MTRSEPAVSAWEDSGSIVIADSEGLEIAEVPSQFIQK